MKKLLLVLVLLGVAQPAFAQEMNVWQTKSSSEAVDSGRGGEKRHAGGGNEIDSRVESVSRAVNRANVRKAPRVKMETWLRGASSGSSDSAGDFVVVARGKHTVLVDNRNPSKVKTKSVATGVQGAQMGYSNMSPDGTVALAADEVKRHQIVELKTGQVLAEGRATGSRFVGKSTVYWWHEQGPNYRRNHHRYDTSRPEITGADGFPPQRGRGGSIYRAN